MGNAQCRLEIGAMFRPLRHTSGKCQLAIISYIDAQGIILHQSYCCMGLQQPLIQLHNYDNPRTSLDLAFLVRYHLAALKTSLPPILCEEVPVFG